MAKLSLLVVGAMTVLTGCGSLHPGVAAVAGSATISHQQVDDVAAGLCSARIAGAAAQGQQAPVLATRNERQTALAVLLETELSQQLGEEMGVEPNQQQVSQTLAQSEEGIQMLPESRRDDFRAALKGFREGELILAEIGLRSLRYQGETDVTIDRATAEGQRLRAEFLKTIDVEVDPRYGTFENNTLRPGGTALSVAASARARAGEKAEPAPGFVSGLPQSQRCS